MSELTLFDAPSQTSERTPVGEDTRMEKPNEVPFLPELAARALCKLGAEWQWHRVEAIYADESDPFNSPLIGTRIRLNIPTTSRTGKKKWPPLKTDRVVIVTEQQEREAGEQWERDNNACHRCGGDGLVWAGSCATRGRKFDTCEKCNGTGTAANVRLMERGEAA